MSTGFSYWRRKRDTPALQAFCLSTAPHCSRYPTAHHPPTKQPHRAVLLNGVCPLGVQIPLWADAQKNKTDVPTEHRFYCVRAIKKIFSAVLRMNLNSCINHGESRVYHQFRRNCISPTRSVEYHQAADRCTLKRDEIQPQRG